VRQEIARTGEATRPPGLTPETARLLSATMTCDSSLAARELDYDGARLSLDELVERSFRWLEREGRL